jgi:hypothetical protein
MLDDLMLSCFAAIKIIPVHHDFFCPLEGCTEPSTRVEARAGYFPIPARLLTNWRCNTKYKIKIGRVAIVTEASSNGQFEAYEP